MYTEQGIQAPFIMDGKGVYSITSITLNRDEQGGAYNYLYFIINYQINAQGKPDHSYDYLPMRCALGDAHLVPFGLKHVKLPDTVSQRTNGLAVFDLNSETWHALNSTL